MIVALLPAAGRSARMGRPKLLLPLGQQTVIARVIATLRSAAVPNVLVVTSADLPELVEAARAAGADVLTLPQPTADMRATILHGLAWIEAHWQLTPEDAFLLVPADHPTLSAEVVRALEAARLRGFSIVVPTHQDRRGHPVLIGWEHVAGIRAAAPGAGLNAYLRDHLDETLEVPWPEPSVLFDLDTPEDYERLLERGSSGHG